MPQNIALTPAQQANSTSPPVYGQVTVDGLAYIERPQLFVLDVQIDVPGQILSGLRLTLPSTADFLLKGLSRVVMAPGDPNTVQNRLFRFRIVNAEGTTWYFTGGLGIFDDLVLSPLCFGTGQFPFPLIPPIPVHANGSLIFDVVDAIPAPPSPTTYPYIIHLGFHGAYLIPAVGAGAGQGPLAFSGNGG